METTAAHTAHSGQLVDDILNGAYENECNNQQDNLLVEDDHALADLDHLN